MKCNNLYFDTLLFQSREKFYLKNKNVFTQAKKLQEFTPTIHIEI